MFSSCDVTVIVDQIPILSNLFSFSHLLKVPFPYTVTLRIMCSNANFLKETIQPQVTVYLYMEFRSNMKKVGMGAVKVGNVP